MDAQVRRPAWLRLASAPEYGLDGLFFLQKNGCGIPVGDPCSRFIMLYYIPTHGAEDGSLSVHAPGKQPEQTA